MTEAVFAQSKDGRQGVEMFGIGNKIQKIKDSKLSVILTKKIMEQLAGQLVLISPGGGSFPDRAKDNWSLGYIAAFCEIYVTNLNYKRDLVPYSVASVMYLLFCNGDKREQVRFNSHYLRFIDLAKQKDVDVLEGYKVGKLELSSVIRGEKAFPIEWVGHVSCK